MKIICFFIFNVFCFGLLSQTVNRTVDTLIVSGGDSLTVIQGRKTVLDVGDTVRVWFWSVSNDSVKWGSLHDFNGRQVTNNRIMIDTLPAYRHYCAVLDNRYPAEMVMWTVRHLIYKRLQKPLITDNAGIGKNSILLLRFDTINLSASYNDLQPDTSYWVGRFFGAPTGIETGMPVVASGEYVNVGVLRDRKGGVIDEIESSKINVNFEYPLRAFVFKSWAGSNDGRPARIDTIRADTCNRELVLDTLRFAVGTPYKYQLVPVIHAFDKPYRFTYRWEHDGFTYVAGADSVLEFNPLRFEHSGSYVFIAQVHNYIRFAVNYRSSPVRVVAATTGNEVSGFRFQASVITGVVYSVTGSVVRRDVSGRLSDIIRGLDVPAGIYFLRDKDKTYKFIKKQ